MTACLYQQFQLSYVGHSSSDRDWLCMEPVGTKYFEVNEIMSWSGHVPLYPSFLAWGSAMPYDEKRHRENTCQWLALRSVFCLLPPLCFCSSPVPCTVVQFVYVVLLLLFVVVVGHCVCVWWSSAMSLALGGVLWSSDYESWRHAGPLLLEPASCTLCSGWKYRLKQAYLFTYFNEVAWVWCFHFCRRGRWSCCIFAISDCIFCNRVLPCFQFCFVWFVCPQTKHRDVSVPPGHVSGCHFDGATG